MKYAEVAVNAPAISPRTFSYALPLRMSANVGDAVWVPFGPRLLQGIVFEIGDRSVVEETRERTEVISPHPLLSPHQIELSIWISQHYLSSLFGAAASMLPPGFERRLLTFIGRVPNPSETATSSLTLSQRQVLNFLQRKGRVELGELGALSGVRRFPVRVKCALLAWWALEEGIEVFRAVHRSRGRREAPSEG